jgi:hypothetical protein
MDHRLRLSPAAAAALVLWGTVAQAAPKAWVDPTDLDLGLIEEGKLFERYVELKNVGDGTLVLEDLKTSCGCTAAAVEGTVELTAGKSEKVRITFNSKGMEGTVKKTVTLVTNDPEQRNLEVALHADVHKTVSYSPKFLDLRGVKAKTPWEQAIKLQSDAPLDLKVKSAVVLGGKQRNEPSRLFDVTVGEPAREGDRDVRQIAVRLRDGAQPQKVAEALMIVTDRPSPDDTLRVMIRGEIEGRIHSSTGFVVLRSVDPGESSRTDVTLSVDDGTFKVLSAEVPDSKVTTEIFPSEGGKQTVVAVSYVGQEAGANGMRTLMIKTDDPDQSVIEIPVRYQTRAAPGQAGQVGQVGREGNAAPTATGAVAPRKTAPDAKNAQGK